MSKKYVLVQNHVREIISPPNTESANGEHKEATSFEKRKKRKHSDKKVLEFPDSCRNEQSSDSSLMTNEELSDFKELREIYYRCQEILQRIESKYGNRLNLLDDESARTFSKRKVKKLNTNSSQSDSDNADKTCTCNSINKKIIFDKSGNKTVIFDLNESKHHVCVCKQLESNAKKSNNQLGDRNAAVTRYNDSEPLFPGPLTEDIKGLSHMLIDTNLDPVLRYRVIEKIKEVRFQVLSELKFNKRSIMKKLRQGDSDIIHFHGTNLMSMSGYLEPTPNEDEIDEENGL